MKSVITALLLTLLIPTYGLASDAGVKIDATMKADGAKGDAKIAPTPAPSTVKPPATTDEAVEQGKSFVSALKDKKWWFASALGIYLIMFTLGWLGIWEKIGTTYAWLAVGVLSLAAAIFLAVDKDGFTWSTFLKYLTAGPTIAWVRDFIKDGISKVKLK